MANLTLQVSDSSATSENLSILTIPLTSTSFTAPTAATNDSAVGDTDWTNPTNAEVADGVYATVSESGTVSHYLKVSGFGFNIPANATITGITVQILRHGSTGGASSGADNSVKLAIAGTIGGNEKASATAWPGADTTATYGSSSDLWGLSLAPSDVNNANFGVGLSVVNNGATFTASVDQITIQVSYYQIASPEFAAIYEYAVTSESVGYYSDLVATREFSNVTLADQIAVSDSTTTSENTQVLLTSSRAVSDSTATSENTQAQISISITVSDSTTTSENVQTRDQDGIAVNDSTATSENTQVVLTSNLVVSDSTTLADTVYTTDEALLFDGVENYVNIPNQSAFSVPTTGTLSVAAWIRPDILDMQKNEPQSGGVGGYVNFIGKSQYGTPNAEEWQWRLYNFSSNHPNQLSFYILNSVGGSGISADIKTSNWGNLVAGQWIHIVGTIDATNVNVYKNGVFAQLRQWSGIITPSATTSPVRIGHNEDGSKPGFFQGAIDDVIIWNYALSATDVTNTYLGNPPTSGIVGRWNLDDGSGLTATDSSGNGYDGTLTPTPTPPVWVPRNINIVPVALLEIGSFTSNTVSDTVTTSENLAIGEPNGIATSDTISTSENLQVQLVSFVQASDSITTSENVQTRDQDGIGVSDAIVTSENIKLLSTLNVATSDTTATSESINIALALTANLSDPTTTSEGILLLIPILLITALDSTATSENVNVLEEANVATGDSTVTSESVGHYSDLIATREQVNVELAWNISVSDSTTASESTVANIALIVATSDTTYTFTYIPVPGGQYSVGGFGSPYFGQSYFGDGSNIETQSLENVVVQIPININVSDTTTTSENARVAEISNIGISDVTTTSENTQPFLTISLAVSNITATSESVVASNAENVVVSDATTTSESTQLFVTPLFIAVNDISVTAEEFLVNSQGGVAQFDNAVTSENVVVSLIVPGLVISDATTTSELVNAALVDTTTVNDASSTTENTAVRIESNLAALDSITASEAVSTSLVISAGITDSTTTSENTNAELDCNINVSDSASTSEALAAGVALSVAVNDAVTTSEALLFQDQGGIAVLDSVSSSENVAVEMDCFVAASDSTATSESTKTLLLFLINVSDVIHAVDVAVFDYPTPDPEEAVVVTLVNDTYTINLNNDTFAVGLANDTFKVGVI